MAKDNFTLFSSANISYDEYMGWLQQLNAVITPDNPYDARLSKDSRHVWVYFHDKKKLERDMAEMEEEHMAEVRQTLGGEPKSAIGLVANDAEGSKILVVEFAALCAEHYRCLVFQYAGNALYPAEEVLQLRDEGMGFDGYTWETANPNRISWETRIIEEANRREAAKKREESPLTELDTRAEQNKERLEA